MKIEETWQKRNSVHPQENLRFHSDDHFQALWEIPYIYNKCDKVQPYIYVVDDPWVQTVQHYFQLTIDWLKGQVKVITRFTANLDPAFCKKKRKIFFSINQMWAVSLSCFLSWCRPLYTGSRKSLAALISSWADEDWGLNEIHLQNETTMIYVKLKTEDSYHILKMVIAEIDF